MFSKFIVITLLIAVARCRASGGASSFSYGVSDPNTGDVKDHHEKRVGDNVVGQYSLLEADGTKRTVEYSSHPQTGFNAVVRRDGHAVHPSGPFNGGRSLALGGQGYAGVSPLAYGGLTGLNSAYAGSPYGGAYNGLGNGWTQNYGSNGVVGANGWPGAANGGVVISPWSGNYGVDRVFGTNAANGGNVNNFANAWPQNYVANGAYGANGWPQTYGGYGAAGYGGYGAAGNGAAGYGGYGANPLANGLGW